MQDTHKVLESLVGQRIRLKHEEADDFWDAVLAEINQEHYSGRRKPIYVFIWKGPDNQMQGVRATSGPALVINQDVTPPEVTYRSSYGYIDFVDPRESTILTEPIPEEHIQMWEERIRRYSPFLDLLD